MNDLSPRQPFRPLLWADFVIDLQEYLADFPDDICLVGGAVRDLLLNRPSDDLDLITPGDPVHLARKIANHFKGDCFVMDAERGVARVLLSHSEGTLVIDVARMRGATLWDDLVDRDFTVNAIAVPLKGDLNTIIDPLNGEGDIRAKLLRRCSEVSFQNDPLRMLRAVRQSVELNLRIEAATLADLRARVNTLTLVSPERLRDEWYKLLKLPRPVAALRVADALGIIATLLPEVAHLRQLIHPPSTRWEYTLALIDHISTIIASISYHRTDNTAASFALGTMVIQLDRYRQLLVTHLEKQWPNNRSHRALIMLAALLHAVGEGDLSHTLSLADQRIESLKLSNTERTYVLQLIRHRNRLIQVDENLPLSIYRYWRDTGEAGIDVALLSLAHALSGADSGLSQDDWIKLLEKVGGVLDAWFIKHDTQVTPPVLVDGTELVQILHLKPGPIIGELLEAIREAQVIGHINTTDDALNFARAYLRS